jgi:hypothetical protein
VHSGLGPGEQNGLLLRVAERDAGSVRRAWTDPARGNVGECVVTLNYALATRASLGPKTMH